MFLLAALRENEAQPHLLWAGGGQQPLTTLQRPVSPSPSRGLLPWMSSPVLSRVRHTARGLGPTLNPGRAHLKIFSLIPSEKSLLQMRSCSQAPGTVFWRDHHSTCDIHQNGAIKFLNPTSALHLVSSDPWAAPFLGTPSLGLQPRLCWPPSGRPVWDLLLACPLQLGTIPQPSSLISGHGVRTPEVTDPTTVRPLCSAGSGPPPP